MQPDVLCLPKPSRGPAPSRCPVSPAHPEPPGRGAGADPLLPGCFPGRGQSCSSFFPRPRACSSPSGTVRSIPAWNRAAARRKHERMPLSGCTITSLAEAAQGERKSARANAQQTARYSSAAYAQARRWAAGRSRAAGRTTRGTVRAMLLAGSLPCDPRHSSTCPGLVQAA